MIVEPSGIYDVDEFFDVLRDDPIDRWYEIGNVITVVDAKLEPELSDQADYLLASEAANAGCIVLSRSQEAEDAEIENTVAHLNHAMEKVQCKRRFQNDIIIKDWETFDNTDYEKLLSCGYVSENYRKMHIEEGEIFKSLYFMNLDKTKEEITEAAEKVLEDRECGNVSIIVFTYLYHSCIIYLDENMKGSALLWRKKHFFPEKKNQKSYLRKYPKINGHVKN